MGFSFFENMRGDLVDNSGHTHFIDFDIKGEAPKFSQFLKDGKTRISGVVHIQPWAKNATLEGTLRIAPLTSRTLEYEFDFSGDDNRQYHFSGRKNLEWKRPLETMTTMSAKLSRQGQSLASGFLAFDMNNVLAFLASFKPGTSRLKLELNAPLPNGQRPLATLLEEEIKTVRACGEAIIAPGVHVPPFDEESLKGAVLAAEQLPSYLLSAYQIALRALEALTIAGTRQSIAQLPLTKRQQWLEKLCRSRAGSSCLDFIALPIKISHFNRRDYLESVGVPTFEHQAIEPCPRYMDNVSPAAVLAEETEIEADVVVIGTGAGGGPTAAVLAEAGLAVVVLEAGDYLKRQDFSGNPIGRLRKMWLNRGMMLSAGNVPILFPQGRLVGGCTAINAGTCFRTPDAVLDHWRDHLNFPEDFSPKQFSTYLNSVEEELQVCPAKKEFIGTIGNIVARGAREMGGYAQPLRRNAPDCDGRGECTVGCPTNARRSTNISYIPRALKANAKLLTGLSMRRILRRGRRIIGVEAFGRDSCGAPKRVLVKARATVISAGAIMTPKLLMENGFRLPWVGSNLSIHPSLGMFVRYPEPIAPWNAIPQGVEAGGIGDSRIRFEGGYTPPQLSSGFIPVTGKALTHWMDHQASVSLFGFMVSDRGVGNVRPGPGNQPLIYYPITSETRNLIQQASAHLAEMLIRGGGVEVLAGLGPIKEVKSVDEARRIADARLYASDFRLVGFHPLGTCRLGRDSDHGALDFEHRLFGTDNLYVIDGSSIPTSLGVNPQVTIMSFALRAAQILAEQLI
tara:strand:- start:398 stop:2779 length:2382 start_codon:yes stop_codon:yes gene_type:complete